MEIKRQSIAFNIINNFKETEVDPIIKVVNTLNENFNKGLVDELTTNQAFEELDNLIEKGMGGHKYFKREGTPGNYKYYYTEADWKARQSSSSEPTEIVSEHGMTKKEHEERVNGEEMKLNQKTLSSASHREAIAKFSEKEPVEGSDIKVGQKYHSPAPEGGEAIDFMIKKIDNGKYTIETINEEGRKGEHTFDEKTIKELISESKPKNNKDKEFTKEGLEGTSSEKSKETRKEFPKIKDVHLASLKEGGMTIDAVVDGQKVGPVKLSKEDLNNFTDKTDRLELAKKYFLYDHDKVSRERNIHDIVSRHNTKKEELNRQGVDTTISITDKELKESQKDIFDEFKNMSGAEVYKIAKTPNDPLSEHAKIEYNRRAKEKGAIEPTFTESDIDKNKLQQEKDHHEAVKKKPSRKFLNERGVHLGFLSIVKKADFIRKPEIGDKLSEVTYMNPSLSISTEEERDYINSLPEFKFDKIPTNNPNSTTDNYIAVDNKGNKYFVDTQGYDYVRYIVKLK